mmetsp:Transcript_95312/g.264726  ORF Transcript_95312/g.264726 Transcript_95312/m.264726 type:complete len:227 (-) Transcript_95312:127-807(-)
MQLARRHRRRVGNQQVGVRLWYYASLPGLQLQGLMVVHVGVEVKNAGHAVRLGHAELDGEGEQPVLRGEGLQQKAKGGPQRHSLGPERIRGVSNHGPHHIRQADAAVNAGAQVHGLGVGLDAHAGARAAGDDLHAVDNLALVRGAHKGLAAHAANRNGRRSSHFLLQHPRVARRTVALQRVVEVGARDALLLEAMCRRVARNADCTAAAVRLDVEGARHFRECRRH